MTPRAAMLAALPPAARAMCQSKYIDPAEAFLAFHDGLTLEQARSRVRNELRSLGKSWPDRLPPGALIDLDYLHETQKECGLHALDPAEILEAVEAVAAALEAHDAPQSLHLADVQDADTRRMADMFRVTQRRAQQIKKKQIEDAIDSRQICLSLAISTDNESTTGGGAK